MSKILSILLLVLISASLVAAADSPQAVAQDSKRPKALKDWHFYLTSYYTSRKVKGNISRRNEHDSFSTDLVATGTSLDLDTSNGFMYALGARYKRWTLGFTYMPSVFEDEGNGYSLFDVEGPGGNGLLTKLDTSSKVHIDMYLANILYEVVQTPHTSLKVGIGAGASVVKFNITPEGLGVNEISYDGSQPFGFISINMSNNYKNFLFGVNVNFISMNQGGVHVDYSDYTVQFGYRVYHNYFNIDIIAGYRMVNFALEGSGYSDGTPNVYHKYDVDLTLQGPFLGLTLSF